MVAITPMASRLPENAKDGFRADIQGLRAVAVLLVVIYHAAPTLVPGGYIGVDVFFVISGFLITTHLLRGLEARGRIHLSGFYARRALRVLPAAFATLMLTGVAAMIWMPPLQHADLLDWAVASALFVPNVLAGVLGTDYLAESAPSALQHYWSLGVEEQFYLLWPVLLVLAWKLFCRSETALFVTTSVLVAASFLLCMATMQFSQPWAFFSFPTRGWELGTGALVAFAARRWRAWESQVVAGVMATLGLGGLLVAAFVFDSRTPFPGPYAAVPAVATALMILGGTGHLGPGQLLGSRPLQFIGLISYSLYLVHWPLLVITQAAVGHADPLALWKRLSLAVLALPVAYLLFRTVEDPVRRARPMVTMKPVRLMLGAVSSTVLVCALVAGASAAHQRVPLDAGEAVAKTPLTRFPESTSFVPSNLAPTLRESADDTALLYRNGCAGSLLYPDASGCRFGADRDAPLVVLFGDSHAASWFPALHTLAEDGHIRLDASTMGTCPSVQSATPLEHSLAVRCDEWRGEVIRRLNSEPPAVILLANHAPRYEPANSTGFAWRWQDGLAATIASMPAGTRVGVLADVPNMGVSPAICLSAHLADTDVCAVPRPAALRSDLASAERTAAADEGASWLDLTDYLCGPASCPAIIGNLLTHRDGDHLSATFSEALAEPLWQQLGPMLAE